jgi:acetolactate synthase I/II/III large subunit
VIGFGAGMGHHTSDGGKLYPQAEVVQVDLRPRGFWQGRRTADLHLQSDAKVAAEQILAKLKSSGLAKKVHRTPELADRIARAPIDGRAFDIPTNTLDPRAAAVELDKVIPKDWDVVCGVGHYFHFLLPHMRNRAPERYHAVTDSGAIGSALAQALGIAAARGDGKVLLVEGDGSIMLHLQELETVRRTGLRLLICIMNDGGYGAEVHKYRSKGMNPSAAVHGRGNLVEIASSFGLAGATVTAPGKLEKLFSDHQASGATSLWDVHIADNVPSLLYRRVHFKED